MADGAIGSAGPWPAGGPVEPGLLVDEQGRGSSEGERPVGRAPPWTPGRREEGGPEKAGIEPRQPGSWWSRCFPAPCSECGLLARGPLSFPSFWAFGQKAGGPGQHPLGARPGLGSGSEPGSEGGVTRRHHGAATHVTCTGGWPVTPLPPRPSPPTGGSMGQAASGNRGAGLRPWGPGSRSPHSGWRVGRMDDGKGDVGSGGGQGRGPRRFAVSSRASF